MTGNGGAVSDDPFADLPEADRTVVRPRPSGRSGAASSPAPASAAPRGPDARRGAWMAPCRL